MLLLYLSTRRESPDNKQRINVIKQKYSIYSLDKILFQSEHDRLIDLIIEGESMRRFSVMLREGRDVEKEADQLRANNAALLNALGALELENQQLLLGVQEDEPEFIVGESFPNSKHSEASKQDYSVIEIPTIEISQNNIDIRQRQEEIPSPTQPPSKIPTFDGNVVDV